MLVWLGVTFNCSFSKAPVQPRLLKYGLGLFTVKYTGALRNGLRPVISKFIRCLYDATEPAVVILDDGTPEVTCYS